MGRQGGMARRGGAGRAVFRKRIGAWLQDHRSVEKQEDHSLERCFY